MMNFAKLTLMSILLVSWGWSGQPAFAAKQAGPSRVALRPQDELWLISTRELGNFARPEFLCRPQPCYQRFLGTTVHGCAQWTPSCPCEFFGHADPRTITVVYVHGNRVSVDSARRQGLDLYRSLSCGLSEQIKIRLVIWTWPTDPLPNRAAIFRDARVKYRRTPLQAYYLACWLNQFSCQQKVSLIGYSYGAETVLGSLHLMCGGQLQGRQLRCPSSPPRIRMALMAAAVQSNSLLPCGKLERSLCCVEQGLIFYDRQDPALRCFRPTICSVTGPALGLVGLTDPEGCYPGYDRLRQLDVTRLIGRRHSWDLYRRNPYIMRELRCHVIW